ncbi:maleylpyruvate isomerase N-terminal domain-containing protein [Pseudonocardia saturnea]
MGPPDATDRRPVLNVDRVTAQTAFLGQLDRFAGAVEAVTDRDLLAASRCHGWAVVDVVVHVRVGLQEMLGGIGASTDRPPDRDAATYWRDLPPPDGGSDDVDAILWTRRTASAYRRPRGALEHLRMTADTVRTAVEAMAPGAVAFQGHVLSGGDFLATWAVELAVHHLDLGRELDVGSPTAGSLRLGRATVEALAGAPFPDGWSDGLCLLAGSGRAPGYATRRAAATLPVLG